MLDRREADRRDAGKGGARVGRMLARREADSRDAGQGEARLEGYWTEGTQTEEMLDRGRQDWRDTGQKGGRQ